MSSRSAVATDDYPSLLWVTIPTVLLVSAYMVRRWYVARRLRLHGIGKGAPGFQTGVKRIRVTPEIAARIRRGEDVSPEEIARAAAQAEADAAQPVPSTDDSRARPEPVNEWLPDNLTKKKRSKGKKR